MKMVAAAKLKRAQDWIHSARPYAQGIETVLRDLSQRVIRDRYPLFRRREGNKVELVVVTADRGLCGGFNSSILRAGLNFVRDWEEKGASVSMTLIGRKARDFFQRRNIKHRQLWTQIFDRLSYSDASKIGQDLVAAYSEEVFDEVFILYNEFKSVMSQKVTIKKFLPIESVEGESRFLGECLIEPSEEAVLNDLLPRYIEVQIFRILLESAAGELGARMTAMDSASRNAKDLIHKFTLLFNKTRQAAITKELMDIVGGAEAAKAG